MDPQALQQLTVLRRKEVQRQRLGEYEEAVVTLKSKVQRCRGPGHARNCPRQGVRQWHLFVHHAATDVLTTKLVMVLMVASVVVVSLLMPGF